MAKGDKKKRRIAISDACFFLLLFRQHVVVVGCRSSVHSPSLLLALGMKIMFYFYVCFARFCICEKKILEQNENREERFACFCGISFILNLRGICLIMTCPCATLNTPTNHQLCRLIT